MTYRPTLADKFEPVFVFATRALATAGPVAVIVIVVLVAQAGRAHAGTIINSNWKPCATGVQHEEPSWDEVPAWTRKKAISKYFDDEPRLLANHGLCNEKFHRVVLCLPGWDEPGAIDDDWHRVCRLWYAQRSSKHD